MTSNQLHPVPVLDSTGLIRAIRAAVTTGRRDAVVVADVAAVLVAARNGLRTWTGEPTTSWPPRVTSRILHAENGFSVVSLTLPPGTGTTVHDHVTWCAVAVVVGRERETTYRHRGHRLEVARIEHHDPGEVSTLLPPGDIHRVTNDTAEPATSLHVYGVDLRTAGSSVRRVYDLSGNPVPTEEIS